MEGKELNKEGDEGNQNRRKDDDSDSFGLPEINGDDENSVNLDDPFENTWKEKKDEDQPIFSSTTDNYTERSDSYTSTYSYEQETQEPEQPEVQQEAPRSAYYEEAYHEKSSPVGWIILGVVVVVLLGAAAFWYFTSTPKEEPPQVQQVIPEPEPEPEPEPVKPAEPVKVAGVYEIDQPTGRYHVIVASSFDKDLIRDYAFKLSKKGMACNILAPRGNKKFHRLSVADYLTVNEAAVKSDQLKGEYGSDVWVIRY